jgi:hypothetical protein
MKLLKSFTRSFIDPQGNVFQAMLSDGNLCSMPEPAVTVGALLTDSADGKTYFILDLDPALWRGRIAYFESQIQQTNAVLSISRFDQSTSKNAFGRSEDPSPATIANNIPAFIQTGSAGIKDSPDSPQPTGKTTAVIQACEAHPGDRITTNQNEAFKVEVIDKYLHPGLYLLTLSADHR